MTWGLCAVTSCEVLTAASCSEWERSSIPPALNKGQGAETQANRHSVCGGLRAPPSMPRAPTPHVHRSGQAQGNPCDILFPLLLQRSQKALALCWSCRGGARRPLSWGMDRPGSSCWTGMKSSSQVRVATPGFVSWLPPVLSCRLCSPRPSSAPLWPSQGYSACCVFHPSLGSRDFKFQSPETTEVPLCPLSP